jgi:hypothetical protein
MAEQHLNKSMESELKNQSITVFMNLEDIILPKGIVATIEQVVCYNGSETVTVNKENHLVSGLEAYLRAVKNGDREIQIIRVNKLQRINLSLSLAA